MAQVVWTGAVKDLRKLPSNDQKAIQASVNSLEDYPATKSKPLDITKLTDRDSAYRLRVGNYRVLFEPALRTKQARKSSQHESRRNVKD